MARAGMVLDGNLVHRWADILGKAKKAQKKVAESGSDDNFAEDGAEDMIDGSEK
ncbi:hypothetical protein ANO11243_039030 [Dothideomycetidae sp. 11243]|nr:hypothetical protein ANO11243_039030 [fungal sp. No.11243]